VKKTRVNDYVRFIAEFLCFTCKILCISVWACYT